MQNPMKAVVMFIVACGFVVTTVTVAPAKDKQTKISGEVTAVDAQAKTIKVRDKNNQEVTMMVTARTKIKHGKEKMGLTDIQTGTKVTTTYVNEGGNMTAKSIHVGGTKPKHNR